MEDNSNNDNDVVYTDIDGTEYTKANINYMFSIDKFKSIMQSIKDILDSKNNK